MGKFENVIFYSDELEDEGGKRRARSDVYKEGKVRIKRTGWYAVVSNIFFYTIVIPAVWIFLFICGFKFQGRKNMREVKKAKTGYFIFGSHSGERDVTVSYLLALPTRSNTVGYSEALSNGFFRFLVPQLGFIPLPTDPHDMKFFVDAIQFYLDKHQPICIYPEAHIWPSFTGVRNFSRISFRYPAQFHRPIVPVFFARRPRKGLWRLFKHPRVTVLVGETIYPQSEYDERENAKYMGDLCYERLVNLSKVIPQEEVIHYVYRPKSGKGKVKSK